MFTIPYRLTYRIQEVKRAAAALLCFIGVLIPSGAVELRLDGERVTLRAQQESLRGILSEFSRLGVEVRVDPGVDAIVNGDLVDQPLDEVLDELLGDFGYVTRWDQWQTPEGKQFPRLVSMDVFRPGYAHRVRVVPRADAGRFDLVHPTEGPPYVRDEVLIGFRAGTRQETFRSVLASINGTVVGSYPQVGVYRVKLPPNSAVPTIIKQLQAHPNVMAAEPNFATPASALSPTGSSGSGAAPSLNPVAPGKGPALAILDTGLSGKLDFGDLVVGRLDATAPGRSLDDTQGHGSQMALIASGRVSPAGEPPSSTDTGVPLVAIKAFDDAGYASSSSLLESLQFAADKGSRVVSLSWGTENDSDFMRAGIQAAQEAGMIVVAAAGNEPTGKPIYPAAYPGVIAVGALDASGERWEQSNYGDFLDFSAPGQAEFPIGNDGGPGTYAGTSISTPYVALAIGQYLSENPEADSDAVLESLQAAARDAGSPGRDDQYGHGILDAEAIARLLKKP